MKIPGGSRAVAGVPEAFAPLQLQQFSLDDFKSEDGINNFNQFMTQVVRRLNDSSGSTGPVTFPRGVDLQGSQIANLGDLGPDHTAVSFSLAEKKYSAQALAPQLESGQPNSLKTVRRINDSTQRELYSTFLNGVMNTVPTTNSSTISGSGGSVTVSSGYHFYLDGSVVSYASRSDTLPVPSSFSIVSLARAASVVTLITSAPTGYTTSSVITVSGVVDPSFDGTFVLTSATGTTLTYRQVAPNATSTGGSVSSGSVYYYYLRRGSNLLSLAGPFPTDSQQNRLAINKDGSVLIAVAVVTGTGVDLTQSAAGSTPPAATNGNHILTRL